MTWRATISSPQRVAIVGRRSRDATAEAPFAAACGQAGPFLDGRVIIDAVSPNSAAQQRSGSSTGCAAIGALQQTDEALYFCWTAGNDGFSWTYLGRLPTGVNLVWSTRPG